MVEGIMHCYWLSGSAIQFVNLHFYPSQDGYIITDYRNRSYADSSHKSPWVELWFQEEFYVHDIVQVQDAKASVPITIQIFYSLSLSQRLAILCIYNLLFSPASKYESHTSKYGA